MKTDQQLCANAEPSTSPSHNKARSATRYEAKQSINHCGNDLNFSAYLTCLESRKARFSGNYQCLSTGFGYSGA